MPQSVLVIHGAGEPRRRGGKIYWEPLLGPSLGSHYEVHAPRMPGPDEPKYAAWSKAVADLLANLDKPVVVGHSLGASVLLKFLSEADSRPPIAGLFLVATPYWGPEMPEFALRSDFASRLRDLSRLYLYHSRDDNCVSMDHLERYSRALPQAVVRLLDGRGHEFDQPGFPELVADIQSLGSPT